MKPNGSHGTGATPVPLRGHELPDAALEALSPKQRARLDDFRFHRMHDGTIEARWIGSFDGPTIAVWHPQRARWLGPSWRTSRETREPEEA